MMTGQIFHEDSPEDILYSLAGNWKKSVTMTNTKSGVNPSPINQVAKKAEISHLISIHLGVKSDF